VTSSSTFWCELAWLGDDDAVADVAIGIAGDRITSVTVGVPAPPGATVLHGLTLPGLANAHSHAFHRALRGRTQRGTGSFWTWREQMYEVAAALDPERYYHLARAVYGEMALAGITCVGEFHYLHHGTGGQAYADPNAMGDALIAAADDVGVRLTLLDTCYLQGGIGVEPDAIQRRFSDGDALSWATRASALGAGPAVRIGAAIHSVRAVDPASMAIVRAWADREGAPLHAHVSEQPGENEQCQEAYGCTPTQLLDRHGVVSGRFTAVHATHVSEADIAIHGRHGATCCLCPTTERDLADGIGPARALVDAGAHVALGTDSQAVIDLFEEARSVELDERLATNVRGHHPARALAAMATASGHACLGWPEAGQLRAGCLADLVTVGLDSVRLAGTRAADALASVVFAATAADVQHVVVGGRTVVRDGHHVRLDVAGELRAALERP
jgi:formiminoglutamate deiminase